MQEGNIILNLVASGYLRTDRIIKSFQKIRRVDFVRKQDAKEANVNTPLSIGYGQTISQPLTVAIMLELLEPKAGEKILDIGSGSGWTVALLSEIVGSQGKVYGLEIEKNLVKFGQKNVAKYGFLEKGIAEILFGDGYEGLPNYAPFDKIIVAAAALNVPEVLIKQLKIGGRLVIPIGQKDGIQDLVVIDKIKALQTKERRIGGFVFVPLIKNRKINL